MERGIVFIAGIYGVGKSTMCDNLEERLSIPAFSAGDLISEINGEIYGKNKVVGDKTANQNILISAAKKKLLEIPRFILAGHFCIFNAENLVENLPEFVYENLPITRIVLLEADIDAILENIKSRDNRDYPRNSLEYLAEQERNQAIKIAAQLNVPLIIHRMNFDASDIEIVSSNVLGSEL